MRKKSTIIGLMLSLALFCGMIFSANSFADDACSLIGASDPLLCGNPGSDEEIAVMNSVKSSLNIVYLWIGIVAVIVVVIGGVKYMTSSGSPDKVSGAKTTILYALCGLIVTLAAFAMTNLVLDALEGATSIHDRSTGEGSNVPLGRGRHVVRAIDAIGATRLIVGQSLNIKARVIPDYASNQELSFESSDPSIATVDSDGRVESKKDGEVTITISSSDGPKKDIKITVQKPIPVASITAKPGSVVLKKNKTVTVAATTFPTNATDKTLIWASEDEKVATVDQTGTIKGIDYGETTVTVTARNQTTVAKGGNGGIVLATEALTEPAMGSNNKVVAKIKVSVESDYYACQPSTANKKFSGHLNFRPIVMRDLAPHMKDFNYSNFSRKIKEYGGYTSYVKKLGGIYTMFAGVEKKIPVKTACDFQAAAEYAFGLMTVYGIDYDSGTAYHNWGSDTKDDSDAFWKGSSKRSKGDGYGTKDVDTNLSGDMSHFRTNCNYACDALVKKTNLKPYGCGGYNTGAAHSKVGKITNTADLQVGDMVHFFKWRWWHVALVGEVYDDYIVMYDGGSRFINSKQYKIKIRRGAPLLNGTTYSSYYRWYGVRLWDIDQNRTLQGLE